MMGICGKG